MKIGDVVEAKQVKAKSKKPKKIKKVIIMINIKNLHVNVEETKVLKGIDLNVNDGELHVIMGRNGTGKSTLANVLVGKEKYDIINGSINYTNLKQAYLLNLIYLIIGIVLFYLSFLRARIKGTLINMGE